ISDRNQFDIVTNYDFLPRQHGYLFDMLDPGNNTSNSLKHNKHRCLFSPFFDAFKGEINYSAYINYDSYGMEEYFILNKSNRPVASIHRVSNGIVVLLPTIPYQKDNQKLLGVIRSCSKKFLSKHVKTPPPSWIESYSLEGEIPLVDQTVALEAEIIHLQKQKNDFENKK